MLYYAEFTDNPVVVVMDDKWASRCHPLEFSFSAENSMHGLIESQSGLFGQRDDGKFVASDIELAPEKGITLQFPGGVARYDPHGWRQAWGRLGLENRVYTGEEVTLRLILALMVFVPQKKQGGRGCGRTDAKTIVCLVNLVHAYRYLMGAETGRPVSVRKATEAVTYDAETPENLKFLLLMPDDGVIPWPDSWIAEGATPDTPQGIERLRKRADRDKLNGY